MEYDHDEEYSCCKEFFCCIFPSSRSESPSSRSDNHSYRPQPSSTPKIVENPKRGASDFERHVQKQGSISGPDHNKAISEFIAREQVKIRAMSNLGTDDMEIVYPKADEACLGEKKADVNDMFADYINRAKKNIRRTSSLGSKRMISFHGK